MSDHDHDDDHALSNLTNAVLEFSVSNVILPKSVGRPRADHPGRVPHELHQVELFAIRVEEEGGVELVRALGPARERRGGAFEVPGVVLA